MARRSSRRRGAGKPRRRRSRRPGLLPWLGLGALGMATYWMTRPRASKEAGEPRWADRNESPEPELSLMDLPPDAAVAWIPGPSGSLRVVERFPDGPLAVVFIHGLAGRLEHWTPQIRALGSGLRVIAVDLPGHGESDSAPDGDYSITALASSIGAVLDGLGLRRAVLVAHSLGALAALEYARRHPARVQGLLLVDPSGDQSLRSPNQEEIEALREDPRGECERNFRFFLTDARPEAARRVLEDLASTPEATLLGALEGLSDCRPLEALEAYDGPILCVTSECNDSSISLHRLWPRLRVRWIHQASHWLMMDQPDEVLDALWDFLGEV